MLQINFSPQLYDVEQFKKKIKGLKIRS